MTQNGRCPDESSGVASKAGGFAVASKDSAARMCSPWVL
jgi:hypothetical protein